MFYSANSEIIINYIFYFIIICFILLIVKSLLNINYKKQYSIKNKLLNNYIPNISNKIPLKLFQVYHVKDNIPDYVYTNIKKYAPEYDHYILDDHECIIFLKEYFKPIVLETFNELKEGAHKADLIRYCLLYIYGGIYLDIKIELIKPLSEIFTYNQYIYSVLSSSKDHIFQAIIASNPNNIFFLKLIDHIVDTKNPYDYFNFCKDFYNNIRIDTNKPINLGINIGKNQNFYIFEEKCSDNPELCYDGLDKYNVCCFVYDNNEPVIKCRYSSYPWH